MSTAFEDRDSPGVARGTPGEGDFEEALRRALRYPADRVEPTGDGLTRIFRRLAAPWPVRQAWLLFTDCVDLLQLITVWLQPVSARAISGFAAVHGSVRGALRRLASSLAAAAAADSGQHRSGPVRVPDFPGRSNALAARGWLRASMAWLGAAVAGLRASMAWLRASVAWLRPALAAAVTAIIVLTGTVALSQTVARMELSNNRPARISALAGPAPPAGDQRQVRAGDPGGPGPSQVTPAREASPASGGAAGHQHSCAAGSCRSGPAAPESSGKPTAPARPSAAPDSKHANKHHNSHQRHGPQNNSHQHHRPNTGRARGHRH